MKKAFAALVLASTLLVSCASTPTSSILGGSESSSSVSTAERAPLQEVLASFDHAGTNNVTFSIVASSLVTSSGAAPSYANPSMLITYDPTGLLIEPTLSSGWPEAIDGPFGLVELDASNLAGVEPGVYQTSVTTVEESDPDDGSLVSKEVVNLERSELTSPYDVWTPQYMADHAGEIAAEFGRGISSNISTSYDAETIMTVAKCLSVEQVLRQIFPNLVYTRADVTYTRSSVSYIFDIVGYPEGMPSDTSSLGDGFRLARAILYPHDVKIAAYASLFPSDESSSSTEVSE